MKVTIFYENGSVDALEHDMREGLRRLRLFFGPQKEYKVESPTGKVGCRSWLYDNLGEVKPLFIWHEQGCQLSVAC